MYTILSFCQMSLVVVLFSFVLMLYCVVFLVEYLQVSLLLIFLFVIHVFTCMIAV